MLVWCVVGFVVGECFYRFLLGLVKGIVESWIWFIEVVCVVSWRVGVVFVGVGLGFVVWVYWCV